MSPSEPEFSERPQYRTAMATVAAARFQPDQFLVLIEMWQIGSRAILGI